MTTKPTYKLVFTPAAGVPDDVAIRGLRALLKTALRRHGLRCMRAELAQDTAPGAAEPRN